MRIFVAGASGAIGSRLVPQLVERGHEVIGTFNSPGNAKRVERVEITSTSALRSAFVARHDSPGEGAPPANVVTRPPASSTSSCTGA